jgi:predicted  nucleic acid-binding Zn-ribbon protein
MDPGVFLVPVGSIVAIIAAIYVAQAKIIRLRATLPESPSADVTARLQALERGVQALQQELAETQERLDFAERLLSKARDERRIGS